MRASRGLKWDNKTYKLKRSIVVTVAVIGAKVPYVIDHFHKWRPLLHAFVLMLNLLPSF